MASFARTRTSRSQVSGIRCCGQAARECSSNFSPHSDPHPFISLLSVQKGHKLFGRLIRHLSHQQCLTVLILLLACFPQLDVVRNAPMPTLASSSMLGPYERANHKRAEARTETFLSSVIPVVVQLVGRLELKMVAGMVSLCSERWEVAKVLATRVSQAASASSTYRLTGSLVFIARCRPLYHPILPSRDAQAHCCSSCTRGATRTHGAIASRA